MSSYGRYNSQSYAPSAPELPPPSNNYTSQNTNYTQPPPPSYNNYTQPPPPSSNYNNHPHNYPSAQVSSSGYPPSSSGYPPSSSSGYPPSSSSGYPPSSSSGYPPSSSGYPPSSSSGYPPSSSSGYPPSSSSSGYSNFPPGTNQDVIRSFQMVDRDRSGFIDDRELQQALSSSFHSFNLRTIRLLMFLFKHPHESLRIGPKEFTELWNCLGHWRGIFERYDKDRSGKIDPLELRDALYGIGYAVPASVLQLLLSKYSDGNNRRVELGFDSFVECGMIIKGLTDKFKDKDKRYSGSATLAYDDFMSMVIPFLVSYD